MTYTTTLEMTTEGDTLKIVLHDGEDGSAIYANLTDTAEGTDYRSWSVGRDGSKHVIEDALVRGMAPLALLGRVMECLKNVLLVNGQIEMNKIRFERLRRTGQRITLRSMCMDGHHTDAHFDDVEFQQGIIGVGSQEEMNRYRNEAPTAPKEDVKLAPGVEDFLRSLGKGSDEDKGDDAGNETVEV